MDWFYRFKLKYQRYAIRNLAVYACVCFALGYLLVSTDVGAKLYFEWLAFTPKQVLHGQLWRIFTAILYPPTMGYGVIGAVLGILIYYSFASNVEAMMGSFEYNLYFFGSIIIGEIGTLLYYFISGSNYPYLPLYTHFAVFMALAIMYADATVLFFFIIPVKIKYLALFEVVVYIYQFAVGGLYTKIAVAAAFIPVIIFYNVVSRSKGGSGNIFRDIKQAWADRKRKNEWRDNWR